MTSFDVLLANEKRVVCLKMFSCDLRVLARKFASPFGHPTQVPTLLELASTCDYLPVRLARAVQCSTYHNICVPGFIKTVLKITISA